MVDLLPFPAIDKNMPVEIQTQQIINYLIRFKDELEFVISSINDKEIKLTDKQINQINQLISESTNVAEVINSKEFKKAVASASIDIHLNIETGCIEY